MTYYDVAVADAISELGIVKTKKTVGSGYQIEFDESTIVVNEVRIPFDEENARKILGSLFGISAGYVKRMPLELFKTNLQYWFEQTPFPYLFETITDESGTNELTRAVDYSKSPLNRDHLFTELFEGINGTYRLRSLSLKGDVVYLDIELTQDELKNGIQGIRLVADLSLKTGIKLYPLLNLANKPLEESEEEKADGVVSSRNAWFPVAPLEPTKVSTRGKESLEVYDEIVQNFNFLAKDDYTRSIIHELTANAEKTFFLYDGHLRDSLVSLATGKKYKVSGKLAGARFDSLKFNDFQLISFMRGIIGTPYLSSYKVADVHNLQLFFGDVITYPAMITTCQFCHSKLEELEKA